MAKTKFFKSAFDTLAINGVIGNPEGQPAFAYIRVSTDEQGDEGRSGLQRQIFHIHDKAYQEGYCISWERVYAEDESGFLLERPELTNLFRRLQNPKREAHAVILEHLDRLSRNADWHQGYLMEQLEKTLQVKVLFWKEFKSRVERAVMGAIAHEGMELTKMRMKEGIVNKARDGRITSRKRAYGYKFVDDKGKEGKRATKFTYYAIFEDEAVIVRTVFKRVCSGDTLYKILQDFTDAKIPPPARYAAWDMTFLRLMIQNPVYKGEYVANRVYIGEVQKPTKDGLSMRTVKKTIYRPEEEWIRVPVPAIVDAEIWELANEMLVKNRKASRRNEKSEYLLSGLLYCTQCGYVYGGIRQQDKLKDGTYVDYFGYHCSTKRHYTRKNVRHITCDQGYISCRILDNAVWSAVCDILIEPDVLINALESSLLSEKNEQLNQQLAFLEREVSNKSAEDEKLYRAYIAGVFDEKEYKERRQQVKADEEHLSAEIIRLRPQQITSEQFENYKAEILVMSEHLRSKDAPLDHPFELKRRILRIVIDAIHLNQREGWFTLSGSINPSSRYWQYPV